jgi:hypothetical protein
MMYRPNASPKTLTLSSRTIRKPANHKRRRVFSQGYRLVSFRRAIGSFLFAWLSARVFSQGYRLASFRRAIGSRLFASARAGKTPVPASQSARSALHVSAARPTVAQPCSRFNLEFTRSTPAKLAWQHRAHPKEAQRTIRRPNRGNVAASR